MRKKFQDFFDDSEECMRGHGYRSLECVHGTDDELFFWGWVMFPIRALIIWAAIISGIITSFSVFAYEEVFDRLDGTGPSKKRVDVVEWNGNLEIHVYPKGSLSGIGAKLDDREKGKKVMVIAYHLKGSKEPLVRRALLGIPFSGNFKAFVDTTEKEFDKIGLSNQELGKPWSPYKLQPPPKQWGPDGSKHDEHSTPEQLTEMRKNDSTDFKRLGGESPSRRPASVKKNVYVHPAERKFKEPPVIEHDDGGVQEYQW